MRLYHASTAAHWICQGGKGAPLEACRDCRAEKSYKSPFEAASHLFQDHMQDQSLFGSILPESESFLPAFDITDLQIYVREKVSLDNGTDERIRALAESRCASPESHQDAIEQTTPIVIGSIRSQASSSVDSQNVRQTVCINPKELLRSDRSSGNDRTRQEERLLIHLETEDLMELKHQPSYDISSHASSHSDSGDASLFDALFTSSLAFLSDPDTEEVLENLGRELVSEFLIEAADIRSHVHQNSPSSPASHGGSSGQRVSSKQRSSSGTTALTSLEGRNSSNQEDEDSRSPKRPRLEARSYASTESDLLLACPYAKHDPDTYSERNPRREEKQYRRCSSKYLTDIPRLKQHLDRVHSRPDRYCPRCFLDFPTNTMLELHIQQEVRCVAALCPFEKKMNPDQYKTIMRKQMRRSAADCWFDIFKILFPGSPLPSDPYVESGSGIATRVIRQFTTYVEREFPPRLAARIGPEIYGEPWGFDEQVVLGQLLEECIPSLMQELASTFQVGKEDSGFESPGRQTVVS